MTIAKRTRLPRRPKQSPDTEQLVRLATGLGLSGSRVEDSFWELRLSIVIDRLLEDNDEAALTAVLDQLYNAQERAYDALADLIESRCESRVSHQVESRAGKIDKEFDQLLFIVPILAWSRFSIPSGAVPTASLSNATAADTSAVDPGRSTISVRAGSKSENRSAEAKALSASSIETCWAPMAAFSRAIRFES